MTSTQEEKDPTKQEEDDSDAEEIEGMDMDGDDEEDEEEVELDREEDKTASKAVGEMKATKTEDTADEEQVNALATKAAQEMAEARKEQMELMAAETKNEEEKRPSDMGHRLQYLLAQSEVFAHFLAGEILVRRFINMFFAAEVYYANFSLAVTEML